MSLSDMQWQQGAACFVCRELCAMQTNKQVNEVMHLRICKTSFADTQPEWRLSTLKPQLWASACSKEAMMQ